jgi:hypothetical protein
LQVAGEAVHTIYDFVLRSAIQKVIQNVISGIGAVVYDQRLRVPVPRSATWHGRRLLRQGAR